MVTGARAVPLDDPAAADPALAGAKAARLARLRAAGLPVPDGFVLLLPPDEGRPAEPDARDAVLAAYRELAGRAGVAAPVVAVRSSATFEDGPRASAAGLLLTVLGVHGADDLLAAVERCRASGSGDAVRAYRRTGPGAARPVGRDRDPDRPSEPAKPGEPDGPGESGEPGGPGEPGESGESGTSLAVLVQLLVPARLSGVAFTAHPVSGDGEVLVVEAVPGLGEPLVSGRVVPEHVELTRADARVLRQLPGRIRTVLEYDPAARAVVERSLARTGPSGTEPSGADATHADPSGASASPLLGPAELAAVRAVALQAESVLGRPLDLEWVLPDGWRPGDPVVLLQGRPITARTLRAAPGGPAGV